MKLSERLTLAMLLALAALTLIGRPPGAGMRVVAFGGLAVATAALARHAGRAGLRFVRDWLPVAIVIVVYLLLQPLIESMTPWRLDGPLAACDQAHFAGLSDRWRAAFGRPPALTDAVYLAYFSYYLLPAVVAAAAWRRDAATFEQTVLRLLLTFYVTYLGYIVLPAAGPRVPVAEQSAVLGGGWISDAVRAFLRLAESTTLDAFPSGHTAISLVAAALAWRVMRWPLAAAIGLWAGAIVFATVYIQVHYVTDIAAGFVVALAVLGACRLSPRRANSTAT